MKYAVWCALLLGLAIAIAFGAGGEAYAFSTTGSQDCFDCLLPP